MLLRMKAGKLVRQLFSPFRLVRCGVITPGNPCGQCETFEVFFLATVDPSLASYSINGDGRAYNAGDGMNDRRPFLLKISCLDVVIAGDRFQMSFLFVNPDGPPFGTVVIENVSPSVYPPLGASAWVVISNDTGFSIEIVSLECCSIVPCADVPATISVTASLSGNVLTALPDDAGKPNLGAIPTDSSCGFYSGIVRILQTDGSRFAGIVQTNAGVIQLCDASGVSFADWASNCVTPFPVHTPIFGPHMLASAINSPGLIMPVLMEPV